MVNESMFEVVSINKGKGTFITADGTERAFMTDIISEEEINKLTVDGLNAANKRLIKEHKINNLFSRGHNIESSLVTEGDACEPPLCDCGWNKIDKHTWMCVECDKTYDER